MYPLNDTEVPAGSVALHWFGQSSFALKTARGTTILIDPYFPHDRPADKFIHAEPPVREEHVRTDYVLLTHDHRDHTCVETVGRIAAAWPEARMIGPRESIRNLKGAGVAAERLQSIAAGEMIEIAGERVHAVYAKPPAGDPAAGIKPPDVQHLGFVVDAGGVRVYFSGDPIHNFADHDELVEAVGALAPDFGVLTTHPTEGEFPFFAGSVEMARRIGVAYAVPAHYACFVKRNYDPHEWAKHFGSGDPTPIIIGYNEHAVLSPERGVVR